MSTPSPVSPSERQMLVALRTLRQRLEHTEQAAREPIAIVGIGCRLPGGANTPAAYWDLLFHERNAVADIPRQRMDLTDLFDAKPQTPGKTYSRSAGLLDDPAGFDAEFFGISPREAVFMDPQQRLVLETSWEALESGGINPKQLAGQNVGVFIGVTISEYARICSRMLGKEQLPAYLVQGSALNVIPGRLSYALGLQGPSLAIDTACSSSLVAIDQACRALRSSDMPFAIAGGVNLLADPESLVVMSQWGMLSSTGRVRAFDVGADGFVRGEGCGVVVLKRLGEAERAGDRIFGVILGTAVNQDGASSGLTVPNGLSQVALLEQACRRAGVSPAEVGYVEAHGTGTTLGDPIEAEALGRVYGTAAGRREPLRIGSVKTNLGHLESAAGVAGLLKVVLGLQHGVMPAQLGWTAPSEHVRWDGLGLEVVTSARTWEPIGGRRIGGVSSFGFSGTNAHVLVEGRTQPAMASGADTGREALVLSARTSVALRALVERYTLMLEESSDWDWDWDWGWGWAEICATAALGRAVWSERLAVVAGSRAEAAALLRGWLAGEALAGVFAGHVGAGQRQGGAALPGTGEPETLAEAFVRGGAVGWLERWAGRGLRRASLPLYPFQRERYWVERGSGPGPLVGRKMAVAGVAAQFATRLRVEDWVGEHRVGGEAVLPGTGHLELMLEAGRAVLGVQPVLEDVVLAAPLRVAGERAVQTVVEAADGNGRRHRVRVYAQADSGWERVSEGWVRAGVPTPPAAVNLEALQAGLRPGPEPEALYGRLRLRGLDFGVLFRGIERLWGGPGEALGAIALTAPARAGWQIAPWTLDACLQVAAGVDSDSSSEAGDDLYLPLSLERLEMLAPLPASGTLWSHVKIERLDPHTLEANLTVYTPAGSPCIVLHHLRLRKLHPTKVAPAELLYSLEWVSSPLSAPGFAHVLAPLLAGLENEFVRNAGTGEILAYDAFCGELEAFAAAYVLEAFEQLGWPVSEDRKWTVAELAAGWDVVKTQYPLLVRMLEIVEESGCLVRDGADLQIRPLTKRPVQLQLEVLRKRHPFGHTELDLVARCGAALADVLAGRVQGRDVVFATGTEHLERLYRDTLPARLYNGMLATLLGRLVASSPAPVRILEVGAGTGGTTVPVLAALRPLAAPGLQYHVTDVSPLLVRQAKARYADDAFVHPALFNLEHPSEPQEVTGHFQIILAANVLHATADLRTTLHRLRSLLAPGGLLLVVEVTGKQRWADVTVGMLGEWWGFRDHDLRPDYPALASGAWQTLLEQTGFSPVVTLPRKARPNTLIGRQELLVATSPAPGPYLIIGESEFAKATFAEFAGRKVAVEHITLAALEGHLASTPPPSAVLWFAPSSQEALSATSTSPTGALHGPLLALSAAAQALKRIEAPSTSFYVITSGASGPDVSGVAVNVHQAAAVGFAAGIAVELPDLQCRRLDCTGPNPAAAVVREVLANLRDRWIAWRGDDRTVAQLRHVPPVAAGTPRQTLQYTTGIDGLAYVPADDGPAALGPLDVEIEVHATAMNFRDVLQVLGVVQTGLPLGTDCAGVVLRIGDQVTHVQPGDAVVAIAPSCYDSQVVTTEDLVVRKPAGLSLSTAVAQCVPYLTADFALKDVACLRAGERVLIHAAGTGVGLAAVYLALRAGAEVIATAGTEPKREFLKALGLTEVYDSRSRAFAHSIHGGVDVVVNSLTGQAIDDSLSLLRRGGRFVELGKTDLRDRGMTETAWPNTSYLPADLTGPLVEGAPWIRSRLKTLLADVAEGRLPALPVVRFTRAEVRDAFGSMIRAEHTGRIVIEAGGGLTFRGAHLITGGLRGLGLRLAEWLADRGAEHLVLLGRRAPDVSTLEKLHRLELRGVRISILEADVTDARAIHRAIGTGSDLRGVWHSAGVLQNAPLEAQTWETMESVLRPKVDGAWNLHLGTAHLALDHFVLFSSWASIEGSHGQVNHCAANAWMDALAHWRRQQGLTAMSVNWGAWAEIGAAAGPGTQQRLLRAGIEPMAPDDALAAMELALAEDEPQFAIAAINWERYKHSRASLTGSADGSPRSRRSLQHTSAASPHVTESLNEMLALPPAQRHAAIARIVAEAVRSTLGLHPGEEVDPELPLMNFGVDSLLAIELRNVLSTRFERQLPSTLLFDHPTLRTLVSFMERSLVPSVPSDQHIARTVLVASKGLSVLPKNQVAGRTVSAAGEEKKDRIRRHSTLSILESIEQLSDEEIEFQDIE